MRLFVAVFPPEEILDHLKRRLGDVRGVHLTRTDRWHLTVHFIGDVDDDVRPEIERSLDAVPRRGPMTLRLAGGGNFGKVSWVGVDGDVAALSDLHDDVVDVLAAEPTVLKPHLTVAYARNSALREALTEYVGPEWMAREMTLVRSHHATGGGYENLGTWRV